MAQVYIVAGGPGDPDLVTVKGRKIIENADIIFTSFRFFPTEMLAGKKADCTVLEHFDSTYDEKLEIIREGIRAGKTIAYVNMGDPCLYGMINGLTDRLEKAGIEYEIIPGVSAFNASCAILKKQMTGLGLPNTAVCGTHRDTPDAESYLKKIASLGASVALFMSVEEMALVCSSFLTYYPPGTPVAVVSKASQPNQKVVIGDLQSMPQRLKETDVNDGLILIGDFINKEFDYDIEKQFMQQKKAETAAREKI